MNHPRRKPRDSNDGAEVAAKSSLDFSVAVPVPLSTCGKQAMVFTTTQEACL